MAFKSGQFQKIANKFINKTAAAYAKTLIIRTADAVVYGTAQTWTTETGEGIPLTIDLNRVESGLVQTTDKYIFTNASDWTVKPRVDINDIIFDGVEYSIVLVEEDADDAAFFITARAK
jgi:hypothetical protein